MSYRVMAAILDCEKCPRLPIGQPSWINLEWPIEHVSTIKVYRNQHCRVPYMTKKAGKWTISAGDKAFLEEMLNLRLQSGIAWYKLSDLRLSTFDFLIVRYLNILGSLNECQHKVIEILWIHRNLEYMVHIPCKIVIWIIYCFKYGLILATFFVILSS